MIRAGTAADLPGVVTVRTAVRENHLPVEQMAVIGITRQSIAARMAGDTFALFVHPAQAHHPAKWTPPDGQG